MSELDYAGWVARALAFADRLAALDGVVIGHSVADPPLAREVLDRVEADLRRPLPASLRRFYERGAGGVECSYSYEPAAPAQRRLQAVLPDEEQIFGGARVCRAADLADAARSVAEWARDTWVADEPEERDLWDGALPFASLNNGDYLALDLRGGGTEPPVVYLAHDDESAGLPPLAPHFTSFLSAWERLCYIGPEHWLLDEFRGPDGALDPDSTRAARLRELLGVA